VHLNDYSKVRTALQSNAAPANQATRAALAGDLQEALLSTGAFHTVEVDCTDDADRLVIAMVGFEPGADASVLAGRLQRLWLDRLGQGFWTAKGLLVEDGHVELLAATRPNVRDGYVTLHLVAQAAEAPAVAHQPEVKPVAASVQVAIDTQRAVARGWAARLFARPAASRVA
jgi:hypothetical protein